MPYDEVLAARVDEVLGDRSDVTERRMFGGLAWLVRGNLAVAAHSRDGLLLVRVGAANHDAMLAEPGAATAIMGSRPMRGWVTVAPDAVATPEELAAWVRRGVDYALTLPPK